MEICFKHEHKRDFCLSRMWLWRLCKDQGWVSRCSFGNSEKLPQDWKRNVLDYVLRIAYFRFLYRVPPSLIINFDHTPIHFIQLKGKTWQTGNEQSQETRGQGDKRQFTAVLGTAADGTQLPAQLVFEVKTSRGLPELERLPEFVGSPDYVETAKVVWTRKKLDGKVVKENVDNNKPMKGASTTVGFKLNETGSMQYRFLGHFAGTNTHWSDHLTSIELVKHIVVPYCEKVKRTMDLKDDQVVILIVDVWWGWLDKDFRNFISKSYPSIKLLYVPANCTPAAQPIDKGTAAQLKAGLRLKYGIWVTKVISEQIRNGVKTEDIKLDHSAPTLKRNLARWTNEVLSDLNKNASRKKATWTSIGTFDKENVPELQGKGVMRAFDEDFGRQALQESCRLFPNMEVDPTDENFSENDPSVVADVAEAEHMNDEDIESLINSFLSDEV
eukprot:Pompholyxophrys_punicea_v1_NODE_250_length_2534_cov_2.806374.p1 type:complete len:442 gc:universal NODE_250_length_2534_cov_2.806374:1330-5(-)